MKAIATEQKIPIITDRAFSVFRRSSKPNVPVSSATIFSSASTHVPPSNSKTIDTVVDVGSPNELKMSNRMTSVTITARNMHISSFMENISGWKMP